MEEKQKFKEGNWIIDEFSEEIYRVYGTNAYCLLSTDGTHSTPSMAYMDSKAHVWTIADAKDGDVLVAETPDGMLYTFIFKEIDENGVVWGHCDYRGKLTTDEKEVCYYNCSIRPAYKGEKDLLFSALDEKGLVWNYRTHSLSEALKIDTNSICEGHSENEVDRKEICTIIKSKIDGGTSFDEIKGYCQGILDFLEICGK